MNRTTVVNVKSGDPYDLYIGRANATYGLPQSKWHNPVRLEKEEDRPLAIAKYRLWLLAQPGLLADIHELRGKRLACWCSPKACHGDILAELANSGRSYDPPVALPNWLLPSIRAYWQVEAELRSPALLRLQEICRAHGWSYTATLESLTRDGGAAR